jgi:hypothetical protein
VSRSIPGSVFVHGAPIALSGKHGQVLGVPIVAALGPWTGFAIFVFVRA